MTEWISETIENARTGTGPCAGCPAVADGRSACVNPGLFDPDGELVFVTIEPSHLTDWDGYDNWEAYNDRTTRRFLEDWSGGPILSALLEPIDGLTMHDVWMTDAIKCPPPDGVDNLRRDRAFDHCRSYLTEEIDRVDPRAVVALGNHACSRTLAALGHGSRSVKSSEECGRILEGDPPVILSTHWGNSWLHRTPTAKWGQTWRDDTDALSTEYGSYMDVLRDAIRAV